MIRRRAFCSQPGSCNLVEGAFCRDRPGAAPEGLPEDGRAQLKLTLGDQRRPGGETRRPSVSVCLPRAERMNKNRGLHKSTTIHQHSEDPESASPLEPKLLRGLRSKTPLKSLLTCLSVRASSSETETRNSVCRRIVWVCAEEHPSLRSGGNLSANLCTDSRFLPLSLPP